jgi:hypothetical protein
MTETFYIIAIMFTLDLAGQLGQASNKTQNSKLKTQNSKFNLQWVFLGLALAMTVLLRQVFLLFIPILFLWLLWRSYRYQARSVWVMTGILTGATLILLLSIAPWTYRNYQAFGQFVLLNTNAGFAFYWGNHPIHGYNFISILPAGGPSYQDLIPAELRHLNEAELDRALLKLSLTNITEDPVRYLMLSLSRIKDYFKFWPSADSSLISNLSRLFSFAFFLPLMLYGLLYSFRRSLSIENLILYLFIASYTAIHLLSWALIRYRLPVDAVLLIFASVAILDVQAKLTRRYPKMQFSRSRRLLHSSD